MAEDGAPARNIPGLTPARQRRIRTVFRLLSALSPALSARFAERLFITPRTRRVSHQDAGFLSTAAGRRLPTPHGDVQIYEWPGAGPAVLVLHGWISYAGQLSSIIEGLLAHGMRVVAFDAPAHGRSGGRQADLASFRDALAAVVPTATEVVAVGADRDGIEGLARAERAGVPSFIHRVEDFSSRRYWDRALTVSCHMFEPDLVISAGFMKIVGPSFLDRFGGRFINTHPALLPAFPGMHGVRDALEYGVKVTGCTVFLVDAGTDTGPVIAQAAVPVHDDDDPAVLHAATAAGLGIGLLPDSGGRASTATI